MSISLSAVVIAKNEAANIAHCLKSLAECDDVLLLDDYSSDDTPAIARSLGVRVAQNHFESFACQRNWALDCGDLRHDWALMLDADEALTPAALTAISVAIRTAPPSAAAYLLCRRNWFSGQFLRYADGFPVWIMHLVRRGRARFVDSGHGEVPLPPVDGNVARINEPFLHYPFSHGLSQWVERHNAYSTREALLEHHHGAKQCWCDVFDRDGPRRRRALRNLARGAPLRPLLRFCYHYFWKWGFIDGRAGLGYSYLMAAYEAFILLKQRELETAAE